MKEKKIEQLFEEIQSLRNEFNEKTDFFIKLFYSQMAFCNT
jgi:hypothetical protein